MIVIEVSNSNKDMTRAITPKIKTSLIQTERANLAAAETLIPKVTTNRGDPVSMTNIVAKVTAMIEVDKVKTVAAMIKVIVIKELKEGVNTPHVVIGLKTHKGLPVISNNTINNSSNISNSINPNNTMEDEGVRVIKANNVPQVIVILVNGVTVLIMSLNEITTRRP